MQFELVTVPFGDGLLHGMAHGSGDVVALHLHGTWGNFYENPFVAALAPVYADRGIRYAAVNLPSHDGGSIAESMSDSISALEAWVAELAPPGATVILQGHSLGALKIIHAWQNNHSLTRRVRATVLFSPFDPVAFYGGKTAEEIDANRRAIEAHAAKFGENSFIPEDVFGLWPLNSAMYLAATLTGGEWDVFPSRAGTHLNALQAITCPTLVALGSDDFASFPAPQIVVESLTKQHAFVIEGAPHNFAGKEPELGVKVSAFLDDLNL
ncbi:alpha/beta fold hydrolase [Streptomyces sp. NPDC058674]|uniref:alpha/beta fold hydrolase n=1 Tax=Streptomyces sp. NPDC058674 TaxID=3346592 RepID=UPI00364B369C